MNLPEMKSKLKTYKKEDIIVTAHAKEQAEFRQINMEEVKENITNPEKLVYFEEQKPEKQHEKKYDCYFAYSDNFYHRYIIVINAKIIIVTIISVNRRWQSVVEGKKWKNLK